MWSKYLYAKYTVYFHIQSYYTIIEYHRHIWVTCHVQWCNTWVHRIFHQILEIVPKVMTEMIIAYSSNRFTSLEKSSLATTFGLALVSTKDKFLRGLYKLSLIAMGLVVMLMMMMMMTMITLLPLPQQPSSLSALPKAKEVGRTSSGSGSHITISHRPSCKVWAPHRGKRRTLYLFCCNLQRNFTNEKSSEYTEYSRQVCHTLKWPNKTCRLVW